jgi:hypothetical protein
MAIELTRDIIERAFDEMGLMASRQGVVIDIAVYGGSCLVLASNIRAASVDVDAVFLSEPTVARALADETARRLQLPPEWINEAVRQFAPPKGNPDPNLLPFGEYPRARGSAVGLRVLLPTPAYLLAMKILANRSAEEADKMRTDLDDAVALMKITVISTREDLVALVSECYPNVPGVVTPTLGARINTKIDTLMDAYGQSADARDPTWNAGAGRATRPR